MCIHWGYLFGSNRCLNLLDWNLVGLLVYFFLYCAMLCLSLVFSGFYLFKDVGGLGVLGHCLGFVHEKRIVKAMSLLEMDKL